MKMICKNCKGEGSLFISDCCGASPVGNGDCDSSDFGICPECHDHCDYGVECDECGGTGEVEIQISPTLERILNTLRDIPESGYEYLSYK